MSPLDVLIIFILIIGSWYAVSHVVAHRFNKSVVKGCGCAVERWIGGPNSLFISVLCNNDKIEMFINRLPWDNPVNLLAAFVAGRRPYVAARFMLPVDIGATDASRSGTGRKIGDYYVVNRSTDTELRRGEGNLENYGIRKICAVNHAGYRLRKGPLSRAWICETFFVKWLIYTHKISSFGKPNTYIVETN
jgi:hypothetical protein